MSEEIGKISKPQADNVQLKRKLYLVQNIQNYLPTTLFTLSYISSTIYVA